jgi:N-glycosylase/DNA lyase
MSHGAGFRAKYIRSVAQACSESFDLDRLYRKGYEEAKEQLMELDGIGDKVADCILLFGYGKLAAFPIDVWIKRVVEHDYFRGRRKSVKEIHRFAEERWDGYAGYAQQYLYHSARNEV